MPNAGEYKSKIGLDSLYTALVTVDTADTYTAETPEWFAPAAEASQEPSVSVETDYADDQPYDVMTAEGPTAIKITIPNVALETLAKATGCVFDVTTGRLLDNSGNPPYMALGFRSLKSNGGYRYYWYPKGIFMKPKENAVTKGEKPEPQKVEIEYTAIKTIHKWDLGDVTDSIKRIVGDTDTTNFDATSWFSQVQTPASTTPSALALSSSTPADAATGVVVSANQTLTFNNALRAGSVNNVVLLDASTASPVAGAYTIDLDNKVVTINPTASLTANTAYIITYAVTDIYGQTLRGAINFTTAP